MKTTIDDMKVFIRILEPEVARIQKAIDRFKFLKQNLDFEEIQTAVCTIAMRLPEFWEPGGDEGDGGVTADLKNPPPKKAPSNSKRVPAKVG